MSKILVFTATYNEKVNIAILLKKYKNLKVNLDILIVDDNSPDGTKEVIKNLSKKKNIILKVRKKKLGLNTAHQFAYKFAKKNKYKKLITLDADLSHDPKEIPKILKLLDKHDFVIGSRYSKNGKNSQPLHRYLISYLGNKLIKFITRININEYTTSYRGFNLSKLKKFDLKQIKGKGYSFFMETVIVLKRLNYNCKEIPIYFQDRSHGKSKIPKIEIIRTLKNLIILAFKK